MLDVVKKFTQEIGGDQRNSLLNKFLDGYDTEGQNVFRYRYDVSLLHAMIELSAAHME